MENPLEREIDRYERTGLARAYVADQNDGRFPVIDMLVAGIYGRADDSPERTSRPHFFWTKKTNGGLAMITAQHLPTACVPSYARDTPLPPFLCAALETIKIYAPRANFAKEL